MEGCKAKAWDLGAQARLAACTHVPFDAAVHSAYGASSRGGVVSQEGSLFLDSGASDHVFPTSDYMTEYSPLASPDYVYTPDNKAHEV